MIAKYTARLMKIIFATTLVATLAACGGSSGSNTSGGLFSGGAANEQSGAIGVNSYLWRASLDTLSFMPMQSADPFGGVIISDWYVDPAAEGERFKVTVYILDQRLRADGLKVSVFRQENSGRGWTDAPVKTETAVDLENAILTRARQLRIDSIEQ